ncbi:MAG: S-layer homology domain-containing protein, partial [Oscillospiraceae bacterium]|nr:S-layer homology domain-containing protein [Oscillospiraceae bacterium]
MHRKTHPKEIRTSKAIPLARKLLSLVLSLLLFGNLSLTARATVVTSGYTNYSHYFWDVKSSDWYYSAVQYVNFVGYMKGVSDNQFDPNATLTKAEIITTLFRFTGQIALKSDFKKAPYDDVKDKDDYFSVPVAWAKSKNLAQVIQKDSTHFGPHTTIQRIQIAKLIYKFAKSQGWGGTMPSVSLPYTDISSIKDSTSRQALKWCYYNKVMTGVGDKKFNPNGTVTRAEFAKILQNLDTTVTPAFYTPVCKTKAFCVGTKYENQFFNH